MTRPNCSSLAQALSTKDVSVIVQYIIGHEQEARRASIDDKIKALKFMKENWDTVNKGKPTPREGPQCSKAAFVILQDEESSAPHLQKVVAAIGRDWLSKAGPFFEHAGLKQVAQRAISD